MAYILPGNDLLPWCEHGTPLGHRCQFCPATPPVSAKPAATGWECPRCHRVWNPSVFACNHCQPSPIPPLPADESAPAPEPRSWQYPVGGFAAMSLAIPPEMTGSARARIFRATDEWAEVIPGFQCRLCGPGEQSLSFRLTPAEDAR